MRSHDELDLGRLNDRDRQAVFETFAPEENMRLYERGIRRRLATMLGGDQRRMELAYSLMFTLPGTPVLRYGDEIGMGDDQALPERQAVRTPMQWTAAPHDWPRHHPRCTDMLIDVQGCTYSRLLERHAITFSMY